MQICILIPPSNHVMPQEDEIYLRSDLAGWLYIDTLQPHNVSVLKVNKALGVFTRIS